MRAMRAALLAAGLGLGLLPQALAQTAAETETATEAAAPDAAAVRMNEAMKSYFRHPDPQEILAIFVSLPSETLSAPEIRFITGAFLSQLLNDNPGFGAKLVEGAQGEASEHQATVLQALSFSQHDNRKALARELSGEEAAGALRPGGWDFRTTRPKHPTHLDASWVSFFATGDEEFLFPITASLNWWQDEAAKQKLNKAVQEQNDQESLEELKRAVISDAALWSLLVNARDYPEVRSYLDAFARGGESKAARIAGEIINTVESAKGAAPE